MTRELKQEIDCLQLKPKKVEKRLDFNLRKQLIERIDWQHSTAKKLFKQRFDFPFEKRIETTDRLPTIEGQKIAQTTVRFSISEKN